MKTVKQQIISIIENFNEKDTPDLSKVPFFKGDEFTDDFCKDLIAKKDTFALVDADEKMKNLLFQHIGIKLSGLSQYLLVKPFKHGEKTSYHIIDSCDQIDSVLSEVKTISEQYNKEESGTLTETEPNNEQSISNKKTTQIENFSRAIVLLWDMGIDQEQSDQNDQTPVIWMYTDTFTLSCSGVKAMGYTPPKQDLNAITTYTIRGILNYAKSGDFQWVFVDTLTTLSSDGMKINNNNHRGWGNGAVGVEITQPNLLKYYDCSPSNANNVETVTVQESIQVGYQTGNYTYSESHTSSILDWKVTLQSFNKWLFEMESPFLGSTDKFPESALCRNKGHKGMEKIKPWPELTTNVVRCETMSVWNSGSVLKNNVTIPVSLTFQSPLIALKNSFLSYQAYYWWNTFTRRKNIIIDMSKITY